MASYLRYASIKEGDTVILDGGFTCMPAGPHVVCSDVCGLYIECSHGQHYLDGQVENGFLIGVIGKVENTKTPEYELPPSPTKDGNVWVFGNPGVNNWVEQKLADPAFLRPPSTLDSLTDKPVVRPDRAKDDAGLEKAAKYLEEISAGLRSPGQLVKRSKAERASDIARAEWCDVYAEEIRLLKETP